MSDQYTTYFIPNPSGSNEVLVTVNTNTNTTHSLSLRTGPNTYVDIDPNTFPQSIDPLGGVTIPTKKKGP